MRALSNLREMEESLKDWERSQQHSLEGLKKDKDKRNMIRHAKLVSIKSTIDIASHLISQDSLKRPATYRKIFDILGQAGMISGKLAGELSDLAGFRNVLLHINWDLDLDVIYSILQNDLKTMRSSKDEIKMILELD